MEFPKKLLEHLGDPWSQRTGERALRMEGRGHVGNFLLKY